ncbi:MAG: Lar family restriction alleviation protein [Oscillospiraceae bacterium]|jgi:Lar family restriction alleviation protein
MNEKLKPCPFCGGKANVGLDDFNNKYLVMCGECGVMMGISLEIGVEIINGWTAEIESAELAIENWNRRAENAEV